MQYILALDQGTTSSRAILFDSDGVVRFVAQKEFQQFFPQPGWVEHDPIEIWNSQREVALEVIRQAGLSKGDIAAIGITNQRETTILWERTTGRPIANAIVWQDRRTADICETLKKDPGEEFFRDKTGLMIDAYFSGTKIQWMLDHIPGAREKAQRGELAFGTVDTWLLWNLTEGRLHATDASNASRTLLLNLRTGDWDPELLQILRVPAEILPRVRGSSEIYEEASGEFAGIPVAGIAGDQQAALFGQACFGPGMAKNTYGTGCFMLLHTGTSPVFSSHKLVSTIAWKIGDKTEYALEGSVFMAGAVVQWLRDALGIIRSSSEVEDLALSVADNGGVYLVPGFTGLGAPHWDPYARGTILGLSRGSSKAHLARAALECIAFQTAEILQAMEADASLKLRELRVDGGASVNNLLMQFQADLLGVPVVRPASVETTSLGAAALAGLATKVWPDRAKIGARWKAEREFTPAMDPSRRDELVANWKRAVSRARQWIQ